MSDTSPSAPTTPQAGGPEQPQAGQTSSSETPQAGDTAKQTRTPDDYERELKALRQEAAKYRTQANAYEKAQADAEDAKRSELEKAQKKAADAQKAYDELTRTAQERVTRTEIRSVARELGVKPELATRLIDYAAIEFNDDGDPTNIEPLLKAALKEYGLDAITQGQAAQTSPQRPTAGATNPPRPSQSGMLQGPNGVFGPNEVPRLSDPRLWKRQ